MKTFKEIIADDVHRAFLNPDEFSDIHEIAYGGEPFAAPCQVESWTHGHMTRREAWDVDMDGIFDIKKSIYIETGKLPALPAEGEILRLDGERFRVSGVSDEYGITIIDLSEVAS